MKKKTIKRKRPICKTVSRTYRMTPEQAAEIARRADAENSDETGYVIRAALAAAKKCSGLGL
jgi:uncharacterized protein (DUF1778 family)